MTPQPDTKPWLEFPGNSPSTFALPDYHSVYFSYGFDWIKNKTLGLRITGDFGHARYMSYNIYGEVLGTSLCARKDVEIQALPLNVNPFLPGISPDATNRRYRVHVFCSDTASPTKTQGWENPITFPTLTKTGGAALLAVILRYYLPAGDNRAGVHLPIIEAFDTKDGCPLKLPPNLVPETMPKHLYEEKMAPIWGTIVDNTLRFYHTPGGGEFNNKDNLYLLNAVRKQPDEVVLLKFLAPTYGHDNAQYPNADVRYWAFNQGNADTSTPIGMPDQQFYPAMDGFTYIAMGDPAIADWAQRGGYNFMPWMAATSEPAVILYRNLVTRATPKFAGDITKVPQSDFAQVPITGSNDPRITSLDAKNYIYNYAPTGKKVTQAEFMRNYGGMPSPGFKVSG